MLPIWYTEYKKFIDLSIDTFLKNYFRDGITNEWLKIIKDWVFYATNWWKRIRAILALEFYLLGSGRNIDEISLDDDIVKFCVALELIHAYSLVHDDLPCMDNDEYRRGELTVWRKFWETEAVLIWDLLNTLCFEILADISDSLLAQKAAKLISRNVWFYGMIWGQVDDIYFEKYNDILNLEHLKMLHNKKTWALIKSSVLWWFMLSSTLENYDKCIDFWAKLGLAFQIKDDILDVEWTFEETGKSVWWEEKWFVYFLWLKESKKELKQLLSSCKEIAQSLGSEKIEFIVEYIWNRTK